MNLDDPKLTAFALGELDEAEESAIAREVAQSPQAQRFVHETREIAQALKSDFAAELGERTLPPSNLIDIHDDPWFWSIARPLAIAASIAIFAIVVAIAVGTYKSRHDLRTATGPRPDYADVEGPEVPQPSVSADFAGPNRIPNPLQRGAIERIESVVIGELETDPRSNDGEVRVIEIITDTFRVQRLKNRLTTRTLSKESRRGPDGPVYELMFLDRGGHVVASAGFYRAPGLGFVLHPSKFGYERNGHYFSGSRSAVLPGDWQTGLDYSGYAIPFPDWNECIGYSPGA